MSPRVYKSGKHCLQRVLSKYVRKENFTDVTLVSDDFQTFRAHKLVVSAYSPVLERLLLLNTTLSSEHTVLHVRGFHGRTIQKMLKFMYFGEVTLEKEQLSSFSAAAEELKVLGLVNMSNHVEDPPKRCFAEPSQQCPQSAPSQPLGWQTPNDEVLQSPMDHQTTSASLPLKDSNYETKTKFEAMHETRSMFEATDSEVQPLPEVTDNSVTKENDQDHQQRISVSGQDFLRIKGKYLFLDSEYVFEATDSEERPLPEVKVNPAMKSNVRDNQQMISVCGQGFVRNRGEYAS